MSFTITKSAPELVGPAETTPTRTLPLSFTDRSPCLRYHVELIFVYDCGIEPASVIRKAVSNVLVPYYPVAGRIVVNPDSGEPEIVCNGVGAVFVEAYSDCNLEDVDYFDGLLLLIHKDELIPKEIDDDGVIFLIQVTQFKCGGFTVGIKTMHAVFDGVGASQFMKAIGELATGHVEPTVKPVWCRELIPKREARPNPIQPNPNPERALPSLPTFKFQHYVVDVSVDYVNQLKDQFSDATGRKCSEFDVLAAKVWQCRTRAIAFVDKHTEVHLSFPVNVRSELRGLLPPEGGYYGNCIQPRYVKASAERIADAPLPDIVNLIRTAKEDAATKFRRWMKGDPSEDRPAVADTYAVMNVSDWRRVGIFDVDYGWGKPVNIVPTNDEKHIGSCFLLNAPAPKKGVRIMTNCVVKEHFEAFREEMVKMTD